MTCFDLTEPKNTQEQLARIQKMEDTGMMASRVLETGSRMISTC